MQMKVKSSTHLSMCSMPLDLKIAIATSAGRPWILPKESRLKTVQCSTQIMPFHMTATYGLCLRINGELWDAHSMSRVAACEPGGAKVTCHDVSTLVGANTHKQEAKMAMIWLSHNGQAAIIMDRLGAAVTMGMQQPQSVHYGCNEENCFHHGG